MNKKHWHYLDNQFLSQTRNNFKKSVKLSNYHNSVLNAMRISQPLLEPIYTRYHTLHIALKNSYVKWKHSVNLQKNKTDILEDLLESTYKKVNDWDTAIRSALTFESSDYNFVFSESRKPFLRGTILQKVLAYKQLSIRLTSFVALAATKAEVEAAYLALNVAHNAQEGAKASVKTNSSAVEDARKAAMVMQWRNLGFSMDAFSDNLNFIESLFDIDTLRSRPQTVFTGILDANKKKAIFIRTLLKDDKIMLNNDGDAEIRFYFSNIKGGTHSLPVSIAPHTKITVLMSVFNVPDYGTYRHFTAVNQSTLVATKFIVTIL